MDRRNGASGVFFPSRRPIPCSFTSSFMPRFAIVVALLSLAATVEARPRLDYKLHRVDPASYARIVTSRTIFLNRCVGGCRVLDGLPDSRSNKSDLGHGTLSAFSHGDTVWNEVVSCVKQTFSRF